jgi:hypothetical protein
MGFFLHELIPLELETRYPGIWKKEVSKSDKDLVYLPDALFSVEIKTSSHGSQIFGNRSFAQESDAVGRKAKSGYYLAVNFEKFLHESRPNIRQIRFGWLDHSDWLGQKSSTGQQARLSISADRGKMRVIYAA